MQVTELTTIHLAIHLNRVIFSDQLFNIPKIQACAHQLNIKYDINKGAVQLTGTWQAISEFRKTLKGEIMNYVVNIKTSGIKLDTKLPEVEKPEVNPSHSCAKGISLMSLPLTVMC